ncbi:MAG TPA: hypothetical protein IGS53_15525 [Leptolyngbyaceae cyanobacterium M33_DOE_097]|uniref:Uncharacterized protein n=1 Tax=Oscillatoriales cyanobacterium SpSt-418 TaxID=2282169 RepID=A0A7C3KCT2_9CYAN|nr:hypothetical protein [Leptolyngbyaceae cyanobacterium M33_DOE_097]
MNKPDLAKLLKLFLPETIADTEQHVTDFKLILGAAIGFCLIFGAFLTWMGVFDLVVEEFDHYEVSNATLLVAAGLVIIWLTLTRVGTKPPEKPRRFPFGHRE